MKLKVHILTFFNLADNQCSTYWWHEFDGELDASIFTSIITKHLLKYCVSTACKRVIIFSDGCVYQNRNKTLANALLNFSIEHNIVIEQKYLVKGHSQMECDSAHALIERRHKHNDIFLPSDYVPFSLCTRQIFHSLYKNSGIYKTSRLSSQWTHIRFMMGYPMLKFWSKRTEIFR